MNDSMPRVDLVSVTAENLDKVQLFCGHSPTYRRGYEAKREWLRKRLDEGMRYILLQVNGYNGGMIEYMPGEAAWRGVEAPGYLVIHCLWVIGSNRKHGFGRMLLEQCLEDARGTNGVAVVTSRSHWLPTPKIFLKNGFEPADSLPPFDLLARRLDPNAALPRFSLCQTKAPDGLTLYMSEQCPYFQNTAEITRNAGERLNLRVNIIKVDSADAAQENPCPYGCLAYFYDGELLTYHPAGMKDLLPLLETKIAGKTG